MEKLFNYYLNDDLKDKIYSMIVYPQDDDLLYQINYYPLCKKYINLFYKYIITNWTYCFIDGLSIIWKIYHLCIIQNIDILWKDRYNLNNYLINYKKYISDDIENIYIAELIRILNNNDNIKKILIKKYITKYVMVLKKHQLDYIDTELSIWGDITSYGYNDESLKDFDKETIKNAYNYTSPIIDKKNIYLAILLY